MSLARETSRRSAFARSASGSSRRPSASASRCASVLSRSSATGFERAAPVSTTKLASPSASSVENARTGIRGVIGRRALRQDEAHAGGRVVVVVDQLLEQVLCDRPVRRTRAGRAPSADRTRARERLRQRHAHRHPDLDRGLEVPDPREVLADDEIAVALRELGLRAFCGFGPRMSGLGTASGKGNSRRTPR